MFYFKPHKHGCDEADFHEDVSVLTKSRLDNCSQQLQQKHRDMSKLQEQEKAVVATFQESLGQNNKFEAFLTGVFKRNVKYVKKQEPSEGERK